MNHEDLRVWQEAIELVDRVYELTGHLPPDERFGLISQIQRAAVSIPGNLAEGCGRETTKDLLRFVAIGRGSLAEVKTYLIIIERRRFAPTKAIATVQEQANTVGRLMTAFRRSLIKKVEDQTAPLPPAGDR